MGHKEIMVENINKEWDALQAYIKSLTPEQLTKPADAAGWSVKDHLIHIAVWEVGMVALLNHQSRATAMGLSEEQWGNPDYDYVNEIIKKQHESLSLEAVLKRLDEVHQQLIETLGRLTLEDLERPYNHYAPDDDQTAPVYGWVAGNTFEHYKEHIPWMQAIVGGE